jgi:RNA polymerase sigma factor (sigma-70 family)
MTGKAPDSARFYEEWLVTAAMSGDRQAAERLVARYQPRLLRTARRMLGDGEQAASAVQEAWLAIVPGIKRLRHPTRFATFAFSILRRRCADTIRSAQRGRAMFDTSE